MTEQWDSALYTTYNYVLDCGSIHEIKTFATKILTGMEAFCPYDQGRIYYYNKNGNLCDQYLVNISPDMVDAYHDYYSKVDGGRYSIPQHKDIFNRESVPVRTSRNSPLRGGRTQNVRQDIPFQWLFRENAPYVTKFQVPVSGCTLYCINWESAPKDEFVRDYANFLGLSHSMGFGLYDADNTIRILFMMDRTAHVPYVHREVLPLCFAVPQLEHLYQNMALLPEKQPPASLDKYGSLTSREKDIVRLLYCGSSTKSICGKLHISSSTLYTHMNHIFQKLKVTSRQELLAKMMETDIK